MILLVIMACIIALLFSHGFLMAGLAIFCLWPVFLNLASLLIQLDIGRGR